MAVQAILHDKSGMDMEPYVILGACNPDVTHQALEVDRGTVDTKAHPIRSRTAVSIPTH